MSEALKLVSVNIERDRHLDRLETFLAKEDPDVVCLQEVFKRDFPNIAKGLRMRGIFGSMGKYGAEPEKGDLDLGVGILSHLSFENVRRVYYYGDEDSVDSVVVRLPQDAQRYYKVLLHGTIKKGQKEFTIGTTHFTWNPHGEADEFQRRDMRRLLGVLQGISEIVLCGDFNAPRGGEIFDSIAQYYTDNIPKEYTTSIDVNLHRNAEKLRGRDLMVDGLFSTPCYKAKNVRLVEGVSDHLAIAADITT